MQGFASLSPALADDYSVPEVFGEDLLEVLGEEGRPDYRLVWGWGQGEDKRGGGGGVEEVVGESGCDT